jgi:spore coat-associated protein N
MSATTRKKVLVPLATALAAAAVAVGSGVTFTSESENLASGVTSGTLTQSNSKANAAIFNLTDMKPGDTLHGTLQLTNTGSLPAAFSLTETASSNGFAADNLTLSITDTGSGTVVYAGDFGGLEDGAKKELGNFAPGAASTYRFTVKLAQSADNTQQGKTASASYKWDSVQLDGETFNQ